MSPAEGQKKSIQQELGQKLILLIFIPILLFFIVIQMLIWGISSSQMSEIHRSLTVAVEQNVREHLNLPIQILKNTMRLLEQNGDGKQASLFMDIVVENGEQLTDLYILDPSGKVEFAAMDKAAVIGSDYSAYSFYRELQGESTRWFRPLISSATSRVLYTIALKNEEGRIFVCFYNFSDIQTLVEDLSAGTDSRIALLDEDRYFLAHTDYGVVESRGQETNLDFSKVSQYTEEEGRGYFVRRAALDDLGLFVLIYKRPMDLYGPLIVAMAGFIVLIFALFVMIRLFRNTLVRRMQNDLNLLLSGSGEIIKGNYQIVIEHSEFMELDRLAESFNTMAETLNSVINDLSASNNEVIRVNEYLKDQYRITKTREKELQLVIKHSYDGIVFLDLSYHIIRISETALDLLNLPGREEGYTGESFISMINEYIREELENQLDSTVQEGSIQLNNYRWDRRILEIITIPVLPETNQTSGIIVSFRDITEKTETEERLFRSRKLESVGRLASGVAHDFNNIIQAVSGYTSLLKDCDDQDEKRTYLLNIDSTVNRARSLVKQLLDFYRGETNNREILSIKNVIHDTMSMLGQLVGRGIDIRIEEGRDDIRILAAKSRIEQILINLVVNARDAMDRQGRITVKTGEIIKEGRLYAVLEVRDTGSGIPHEDLEKIFDPFFSTKGPGEGTGLGLSTVFSIVEDYQGIIEVDSIIHSGTTFRILLPEAEA